MFISTYRAWIAFLILLLVLTEICTVLFAYRVYDIITTVFTVIGCVVMLMLVAFLVIRKDDWSFRMIIFIPVVGYLTFKLWVLFEFLTQVD